MVRLETYLERTVHVPSRSSGDAAAFGESVARLEGAIARFDDALRRFSSDTKNLREVQLVVALKPSSRD